MSKYKVFDGTNWLDPCNCKIYVRDTAGDFIRIGPDCTYYYDGTEWKQLVCSCNCPPGYITNNATSTCDKTFLYPIETNVCTYDLVNSTPSALHGNKGSKLYSDISSQTLPLVGFANGSNPAAAGYAYTIYDNNGSGTIPLPVTNQINTGAGLWRATNNSTGRLNIAGIWAKNNLGINYLNDQEFPVTYCLTNTGEYQYLLAVACESKCSISITSSTFLGGVTNQDLVILNPATNNAPPPYALTVTDPHAFFHIFPITLPAGVHNITFKGTRLTGATGYGFVAEIYDIDATTFNSNLFNNTATQLDLNPYIIFSTASLVTSPPLVIMDPLLAPTATVTCPTGTEYSECDGVPACVVDYSFDCQCGTENPPPPPTPSLPAGATCGSSLNAPPGSQGMFYIGFIMSANTCALSVTMNSFSVLDSMQILSQNKCTKYAESGFYGANGFLGAVTPGTYVFGPGQPLSIQVRDINTNTWVTQTTGPTETLVVPPGNNYPVTNTNSFQIPNSINPAIPAENVRTITYTKGPTAGPEFVWIRVVGNPVFSTNWDITNITCTNC